MLGFTEKLWVVANHYKAKILCAGVIMNVFILLVAAEVAELVDAPDSKSGGVPPVWVQVPPSVPLLATTDCCVLARCRHFIAFVGNNRLLRLSTLPALHRLCWQQPTAASWHVAGTSSPFSYRSFTNRFLICIKPILSTCVKETLHDSLWSCPECP